MSNWAVGYNRPGYLPESDPYVTSDWEDARMALIEELEQVDSTDDRPNDKANDAIIEVSNLLPGAEYASDTLAGYVYWLNQTDEEPDHGY